MVHVGKNTRSRIVSKGISAGRSQNAYRGLVQVRRIWLHALICASSASSHMAFTCAVYAQRTATVYLVAGHYSLRHTRAAE